MSKTVFFDGDVWKLFKPQSIRPSERKKVMRNNTLKNLINDLTGSEKKILQIATNAIYFDDNSDYLNALWEIVNEISNNSIEDCDSELFELLNS